MVRGHVLAQVAVDRIIYRIAGRRAHDVPGTVVGVRVAIRVVGMGQSSEDRGTTSIFRATTFSVHDKTPKSSGFVPSA